MNRASRLPPRSHLLALFAAVTLLPLIPMHAGQLDLRAMVAQGQATLTGSETDIGSLQNIFDGNTDTLGRSKAINPMIVTVEFAQPQRLNRSRIWFLAQDNRWRVETADTLGDLDTASGSFQVALDWLTGAQATWHDRTMPDPRPQRFVRLKLQRLTGDNYVHLNEWELHVADTPLRILSVQPGSNEVGLVVSGPSSQWFETQCSSNLFRWDSSGYWKSSGETTDVSLDIGRDSPRFFRIRHARAEERPVIRKRVLVMNIDPVLEDQGGRRLNSYLGWNDSRDLATNYLADLTAAAGGYVDWAIAAWVDLDLWPRKVDGFQYTDRTYLECWSDPQTHPWHSPDTVDYEWLLDLPLSALGNRSAHQLAAAGTVDEVFWFAHPYAGFYESRMVGSGAYWCNSPGLERASPLYIVMGFNPERGVAEMLEDFGHRTESIMARIFGSWSGTATVNHLWDRFTRVGPTHSVTVAGCGNVHYPPNASADYQYQVAAPVLSEADKWLTYPALTGSAAKVNAETWGGPDYHRNYLRWWLGHLPKAPGRYSDPANALNDGKLNNWWAYLVDMNEYAESR